MTYTQQDLNVELPAIPRRGKRTAKVYQEIFDYHYECIEFHIKNYSQAKNETVKLEVALKALQDHVRRYHEYCLKQNFGGYYKQNTKDKTTWEHIIPIGVCVNRVLHGVLTVKDFMQMPVMYLSKKDDEKLRRAKLVKTTPDMYYPFKRYAQAGIDLTTITTLDGEPVDENYTFNDHVETVKRLTTP